MIRIFLFLMMVLTVAAPVSAETYKWIDDRGTVNFTEDYSQIPKKYRKKTRMIGDVGASSPEVASGNVGESKNEWSGASSAESNQATTVGKPEKKVATFGGKNGDEWSGEFGKISSEIKNVEEQIAQRRDKLSHPEKLTRAQYLGTEYEIKDLQAKLEELRGKRSALDETASRVGVPYEFRK
jgi:hypothetical protein